MRAFLAAVNRLFDLLFWPFQSLNPLYSLVTVSFLTGILMLLIFRYTSDQREIKKAKDRIQAHLLEFRLFQDQLGVLLRAHVRVVRWTLVYMKHSLKPLAVMLLPLVLVMIQLEMHLGYTPAKPQESFVLTARLADPALLEQVTLRLPVGLTLSAPPVRIPSEHQVDWRLQADRAGEFTVEVVTPAATATKQVTVAQHLARVSPQRVRPSLLDELLYPGEPPLPPDSPLEAIEVNYPRRNLNWKLFQTHWLIPFFVLSLVSGWAMKGILRTEI